MKRLLWLCAAVLALFGFAQAEPGCHHWVLCQAPTVCAACGAQDVSVSEDDVVHEWLYANLGNMHQMFCLYCDYEEDPEEHFAFCDTPDVCASCGAKGLVLTDDCISHDAAYIDLGTQHQYSCSLCGMQDEPENHWAVCTDPVTCVVCGSVKIDVPDSEMSHKETYCILDGQHQIICSQCDYVEPPTEHLAICTEPEVCYYCKSVIPAVSAENKLHLTANVVTQITDATHEKCCTGCGFSWGVFPHRVSCADPTVCFACGKTGLRAGDFVCHHDGPFTDLVITGTDHSFDCGQCSKHVEHEAHTFDKGFCDTCGYEQGTDAPDIPDTPDDSARIPGDADGDGAVSIMDALAILQYDVGWGTAINAANADVDDDGEASIMDALLILQYDVGWDVELK